METTQNTNGITIRRLGPADETAIERLVEQGQLRRVQIVDGDSTWPEEWFMHAEDAPLLRDLQNGAWQPRTTLLSPFDNLICDRARTEKLFEFYFRIEIYVPAAKRQFGYYVLPVLHGDRLIGRIDPRFDKPARRLLINAVYAEPQAAGDQEAGKATADAIGELAQFLDAEEVVYQGPVPEAWQGSMPVA